MHPISDKELDKLFQQRFEEAEFQPSEHVWDKITAKMDQKEKAKRVFPVFWMAAASVLILLGTGMWFYRPVEVIKLQGTPQQMVHQENTKDVVAPEAPIIEPEQIIIKGFDFSKLAAADQQELDLQEEIPTPEKAVEEEPKQELTASTNPRKNSSEVSQPGKEIKVPRYKGDQSQLDVTQADMIANAEVSGDDIVAENIAEPTRRVRGIGGIINLVISKVDHREDKIIEFKDGDEGSEVSGINLGLIKLKSRIK